EGPAGGGAVRGRGEGEPGEVALRGLVETEERERVAEARALDEPPSVGGDVVHDQAAHGREHGTEPAVEGDRVEGGVGSHPRPREPDLVALRRPGEALDARPALGQRAPGTLAVDHDDRAAVVAPDRVFEEGDALAVGGDPAMGRAEGLAEDGPDRELDLVP